MWYPDVIPDWASMVFPWSEWHKRRSGNSVYITFDDGPVPGVTDSVLQMLSTAGARTSFFCVGEQAESYPELLKKIREGGHTIGNHSHNHLNGWKTKTQKYIDNVGRADKLLHTALFRPPYGRITFRQARKLRQSGFTIVMWDVVAGDFDPKRSATDILDHLKRHTRPGSIVVLHDNSKSWGKVREFLPSYLDFLKDQGYAMDSLPG